MLKSIKYALFTGFVFLPSIAFTAEAAGGSSDPVDKTAARLTGSKMYVSVTGLNVPIAQWDGYSGMIAVDAGLEAADAEQKERIRAIMPRVKDALRRSVNGYVNGFYTQGSVPDLDLLIGRMQRSVDKAVGKDVAVVTVSAVIIHPYRN